MEFKHTFTCACGRTHTCPIREVRIGHGVLSQVPALLSGIRQVLIVSDSNTRPLAFEALSAALDETGIRFQEAYFDQTDVLIPDEQAISSIEQALFEECQAIIGIGSGVINDLCKYVSFQKNLPYMIIATAPSMDGYASSGAAMILKGMKVTVSTRVPAWIVGDTGILKDAPMDMIRAGIGDILGKYSCLNDWKLSHLITDEPFCQTIYDMTLQEVLKTRDNIRGCMEREERVIGELMTSLVQVGIAMAYNGNSRPASGAEHHFSHFFEITGVAMGKPYLPHGIDVAYSTVLTARMRQQLAEEDPASFHYAFDEAKWRRQLTPVFGPVAEEVEALQKRSGLYQTDRLARIREKWVEIVQVLKEAPSAEEMLALLKEAGYEWDSFTRFYGEARIRTCLCWAKDLKDRYTLLWLLENARLLRAYASRLRIHLTNSSPQ